MTKTKHLNAPSVYELNNMTFRELFPNGYTTVMMNFNDGISAEINRDPHGPITFTVRKDGFAVYLPGVSREDGQSIVTTEDKVMDLLTRTAEAVTNNKELPYLTPSAICDAVINKWPNQAEAKGKPYTGVKDAVNALVQRKHGTQEPKEAETDGVFLDGMHKMSKAQQAINQYKLEAEARKMYRDTEHWSQVVTKKLESGSLAAIQEKSPLTHLRDQLNKASETLKTEFNLGQTRSVA